MSFRGYNLRITPQYSRRSSRTVEASESGSHWTAGGPIRGNTRASLTSRARLGNNGAGYSIPPTRSFPSARSEATANSHLESHRFALTSKRSCLKIDLKRNSKDKIFHQNVRLRFEFVVSFVPLKTSRPLRREELSLKGAATTLANMIYKPLALQNGY